MTDSPKLWISTALTPFGHEYGLVAVVASSREEAIAKATAKLEQGGQSNYVPAQRYAQALTDGLAQMREVEDGVVID